MIGFVHIGNRASVHDYVVAMVLLLLVIVVIVLPGITLYPFAICGYDCFLPGGPEWHYYRVRTSKIHPKRR